MANELDPIPKGNIGDDESTSDEPTVSGKYYLLAIAINNYNAETSGFPSLSNPVPDIKRIVKELTTHYQFEANDEQKQFLNSNAEDFKLALNDVAPTTTVLLVNETAISINITNSLAKTSRYFKTRRFFTYLFFRAWRRF